MNDTNYCIQSRVVTRGKKNTLPLKTLLLKHQSHLRKNTQMGNQAFWMHITNFAGEELTIKQISPKFCRQFAEYLISHVQINSARTYLQKLHAILHEAVNLGYLSANPMPPLCDLLPRYHAPERAYLTVEEIKKLRNTPCPHESTKLAFLFACYTGLRISDIETLKWEHIQPCNNVTMLIKTQIKTDQDVRIPLGYESLQILKLLKKDSNTDSYIFHLHSRTTICSDLKIWARNANIRKHVTFHVSRHSFATLSLAAGVSLFTVSKLCGHTNIKTTQIYARLLDSTRIKAIESLDQLFSDKKSRKKKSINPYDLII